MCNTQSAQGVGRAAAALTAACVRVCPDEVGDALRAVYNAILQEPVPQDMLDRVAKLK